MKLSIIIPVYNDRDYLTQAIAQVRAVTFPLPYEIIGVDDCSTDGSRELLRKLPGVTALFHDQNTGKGGAIQTGLRHATGDIIAIQDDDCEYDPAALPHLIEPIMRGEAQVVYGSRFLRKNSMFFVQRLENKAMTWLTNILLGQSLTDIETGHKVFTRRAAQQIVLRKRGFEFDMEITLQFINRGYHIKELPTSYAARTHAEGKKITYRDGLRSIATLLRFWWRPDNRQRHIRQLWRRLRGPLMVVLLLCSIFIPRLIGLGQQLTIDEPLWQSRGGQFITGFASGHFERTLVAGQPGITTAWLVGITTPSETLGSAQAAIAVATGGLIALCGYFLWRLWSWWGGLATAILALDPFLLGHSRVIHTDALLALFYLASVLAALVALSPRRTNQPLIWRYLIASAVLAGGALLTKLLAIVSIPTILLMIAVTAWRYRWPPLIGIRAAAVWLTVMLLTVYLFWPALWTDANLVYDYLTERIEVHTEGTRELEITSRPWYYLREGIFRLTVPGTILLPLGLLAAIVSRPSRQRWSTLWLCFAGLIFVGVASGGGDKSDRYILFTLLAVQLTGVFGVAAIYHRLHRWSRIGAMAMLLLVPTWLAIDAARLHPDYLAHYNRWYPVEADHKLGWGEGLERAAAWIAQQNPQAKVLSYYPRVFGYFYPGEVGTITHLDAARAEYIVLYRSMFERGPDAPETDIVERFLGMGGPDPVHVISLNGLPYVWIFAVP